MTSALVSSSDWRTTSDAVALGIALRSRARRIGLEDDVAHLGELAPDDDDLGVEQVDQAGDGDAEVATGVLEHAATARGRPRAPGG